MQLNDAQLLGQTSELPKIKKQSKSSESDASKIKAIEEQRGVVEL